MDMRSCLLTVFLCVWMERISALSIEIIPQYPIVGQSVTFRVTGITGILREFTWYKGEETNVNKIFSYNVNASSQFNGNAYFPRAGGFPDASLLISNLAVQDRGTYTVTTVKQDSKQKNSLYLTLYHHLSKPVIRVSELQPLENTDVRMTCDVNNAERIFWHNTTNITPLVLFSHGGKTITFPRSKRTDASGYWCVGENLVSRATSDIYTLEIYYGPDNPSFVIAIHIRAGSIFNLECGNDTSSSYQWTFNGTQLRVNQSILRVEKAKPNHQGLYVCEVYKPGKLYTAIKMYVTVNEADRSCAETVTGIICATILGGMLIISATFLRHTGNKDPKKAGQNPDTQELKIYYNIVDAENTQPDKDEPTYTDLQAKCQDTYEKLQKR